MISITGGQFRGHPIQTPKGDLTRPTLAKIRQALFNSLQAEMQDARVLDLFSGSGALGLEALSRNADSAVFIDTSAEAVRCLKENLKRLKIPQQKTDVLKKEITSQTHFFEEIAKRGPFNVIFSDPPYESRIGLELIERWDFSKLLAENGYFILEWDPKKGPYKELPTQGLALVKVREKNYGDTWLTHYQMNPSPERI